MSDLVEHILTNNLVDAKELFEERMNLIAQRKLVEMKKQMQAEAFGMLKFTKAEIEAKKKAGFRKATDVLGEPGSKMKPLVKLKKKKVNEETIDEAGLAIGVAGARNLAKRPIAKKLFKAAMALRKFGKKTDTHSASDDEAMRRAAGAEPSQTSSEPKKTSILKPQGGVKGAYGVWMQKEKPKSVGGHALSLISKTLSQAGS